MNAIVAADGSNAIYARNLALAYERLAAAFELAGSRLTEGRESRAGNLREAESCYGKARDIFAGLRDRHVLMPNDSDQVAKFSARIAAVDRALGQLAIR